MMLEKIRFIFIIIALIYGAFVIIIPSIQDSKRQGKVSQKDIDSYIENSQSIYLDDIELIEKKRHVTYADPVMTNRYAKKKNTLLIKDNISNKYYQTESYDTRIDANPGGDIKNKVYLIVNATDNEGRGIIENPIIVLRHYINPKRPDYYIDDDLYQFGVKEYLTYRDSEPVSESSGTILGIIAAIFVLGIAITSVMIAKQAQQG